MSDESAAKLYALAIVAVRPTEADRVEVSVRSALALVPDGVSIEQYGMEVARNLFPVDEKWGDPVIHPLEIVQGMPFGLGHHLEWDIKENKVENQG